MTASQPENTATQAQHTAANAPLWRGIFPALTTRLHADESLDLDGQAAHADRQIRAGVHGLVACGSLGEASTLSVDEKLAVTRTMLQASAGRVPVLATVAEPSTRGAIAFAEAAARAGADGLMLLPGVLYAADAREAMAHVRAVAQAAALPVMVYNNPVSYRVDLRPEHFAELADCAWLVAIKESSDDIRRITALRSLLGQRYQLFIGVDDLSFEGLALGCDGLLAGLCNALPHETVALYDLMRAGDWVAARTLYQWFSPLLKLDVSTKLVQNIKLVEARLGVGNEHVRRPRLPLAGQERAQVLTLIDAALARRPAVLP